jgi:hypothetical protein
VPPISPTLIIIKCIRPHAARAHLDLGWASGRANKSPRGGGGASSAAAEGGTRRGLG